ncbi:MAG: 1-acyl-sn-glycerol-3-phosphate acyltransferase [Dysgonamonadaceae bacterium]|nr:1-acyl-sn-glycerol-3-phosphate acyltransferase [Dysgonamonadaceae bacterium]
MDNNELFQIDIHRIVSEKLGNRRKIPKFLTRLLAWIVKQDGLNAFLRYSGTAVGVETMRNAVDYFDIHLNLIHPEKIPKEGKRLIFVSNHPLGGLDGICLSAVLGNLFDGKIKYLVNDLLYFIKPLQPLFIPINKHGSQAKQDMLSLNAAFLSDNQIITFPAGLCSRKQHGIIADMEWKKMFVSKAIEYHRDVVPIYFEAANSAFFYHLATIRKRLKLKFNLEMLFLPREMFKAKGSTFTLYFGEPIPWQTFDSSKSMPEWAEWVKQMVYELKNNK